MALGELTSGTRRGTAIVWGWSALLALVVCLPLLRPGYVLTYDMVWVPHLDVSRLETWGLGSALPRAVPSDAVVALLGSVVPAAIVQRVVLFGVFVVGAVGAARLVRTLPLPARLATATFFVWNPFVAERLVLGQWPLLVGLAALPWLIDALTGDRRRPLRLVIAVAGLSMTPVGGLLALVVVLVLGHRDLRVRLVAVVAALNSPWIVAGLLHRDAATSDPAGVTVFAVQSDGPLGRLWSALSLGGIWNGDVVPGSRELWTTAVLVLVGWVVMAVGLRHWWRQGGSTAPRLAALAGIGLVVACAGWWAPGLLRLLAEDVPGGGLLRDGTRFLMLVVPLCAVALGHGAAALTARVTPRVTANFVAALVVLLPVASMPDLANGVSGRLETVSYPSDWDEIRQAVQDSEVTGDLLVLPFDSYRAPSWNGNRPVLDPAGRYFDRTTVVSDDLVVSGLRILGEDPRVARLAPIVGTGMLDPATLQAEGIGMVLVDLGAPGASGALTATTQLRPLISRGDLALFETGDAVPDRPGAGERRLVGGAWVVAGATLLGPALLAAYRGSRRKTGRGR